MYLMPIALTRSAEEKEFESFGKLLSYLEGTSYKIKRIWAVSAYYDIDSIKQLIEYIKSRSSKKQKPELFIVIGSINSGELKDLQGMKFGNEFKEGSGIRVTKGGWLFHSKGYLVETTNRSGMCAIGSMNLTQAGLTKNEEILTYSQYKHSKIPALVASFKNYVEDWHLDDWSKEIGAISEGEKGIRWLKKNHPRDKSTQEHEELVQENESMQENDSKGSLSDTEFPDIPLGLHKNDKKFTSALYKLLFQKCRFRPEPHEYGGVTLLPIKPGKNKQYFASSARFGRSVRFDVTLRNRTYHCNVGVYHDTRTYAGGLTSVLNVRVKKNKQKKFVNALQLTVSKLGRENIWKGQYWKIYHDGSMARKNGKGIKSEKVLSAVSEAVKAAGDRKRWIEKPRWSKKKLVCLGELHVEEKVTWRNSRNFLARLLHYAIIRADKI